MYWKSPNTDTPSLFTLKALKFDPLFIINESETSEPVISKLPLTLNKPSVFPNVNLGLAPKLPLSLNWISVFDVDENPVSDGS